VLKPSLKIIKKQFGKDFEIALGLFVTCYKSQFMSTLFSTRHSVEVTKHSSTVTRLDYKLGNPLFEFQQLQEIYLSSKYKDQLRGSPTQWILGILSLGVKWPGHDINHSHLVLMLKTCSFTPPLPVFICVGATEFN
jgi:hypothetical protein